MTRAHPVYFGSESRPLFGWIHRPESGRVANVGLLICAPLGYESITSHRALRHLAQMAAAQGVCAMRFDYDGIGDSSGNDSDPERMQAWLDSILGAATAMQAETGVQQLCLFGMRLGGALALAAAQQLPQVVAAVLTNPVTDGRRYLRELRALGAMSATASAEGNDAEAGIQVAAGFVTTAATREALGSLNLESVLSAPGHILLMERTDFPGDDRLVEHLKGLGASVIRRPFPRYEEMMRDPHESEVPEAALQGIVDWVGELAGPAMVIAKEPALPGFCEIEWAEGEARGKVRETAQFIADDGGIFGIVSEPSDRPFAATPAKEIPALLLLNSGSVHHVGPNRLYVRIARRMATQGFRVLRLDLLGLGDSPADPGQEENIPYPDLPLLPLSRVFAGVRNKLRTREVHCAGICSGAYHSLKAAVGGEELASILVVNPLTYFWKPGMELSTPVYRDTAELANYQRVGLSWASIRKLASGKVDIARLAGVMQRHIKRRAHGLLRVVGRTLGVRLRDDLVLELRRVRDQGTRIHFVFSDDDPGYPMLLEQAGAEVRSFLGTGAMDIQFIPNAGHTFTPLTSQKALLDAIANTLGRQLDKGIS